MEQFLSLDFLTTIATKFDFFMGALDSYLSGANNLKIVSLVLMLLALILFLFLIIVIYVRNVIYFVKSNKTVKQLAYRSRRVVFFIYSLLRQTLLTLR